MYEDFIKEARKIYGSSFIPLHRPVFEGNERVYLEECIQTNFVSSVGAKVIEFEEMIAEFTNSKFAVATVNGTSALHTSIQLAGVKHGDEVITQSLTFVATCNAIAYSGASPIFVDVDLDTMGLSPYALEKFLNENAVHNKGELINKNTNKRIAGCVPMHTFGFPCRINEISDICIKWGIPLIEDIAESLGSYVNDTHTGNFGKMGTLSFNGNKVITTGGGGMIITNDEELALRAKHITTTSKMPHEYEFVHDEVGYNYRMPNLNAALGCAQVEQLSGFLKKKNEISQIWRNFFHDYEDINFFTGIENTKSNNWLNVIIMRSKKIRDDFLKFTNSEGVMTRPIWRLMSNLEMYKNCQNDGLENSIWLEERVVNIPSSVPINLE